MAHARTRHILPLVLKKLAFSPIVAIQGARQTGKSFLVRELLRQKLPKLAYVTLDQPSVRDFASSNPETFLSQYATALPLAVDEAQKAPRLFDALKFFVDRDKQRGKYLILGSTEFSKMTLIRESLTGRQTRIRLFPLNLAETLSLPANSSKNEAFLLDRPRVTREQLVHYLSRGGMPGIFAIRDTSERESSLRDWLDLTAQRDALLFPKIKIDPDLCSRILAQIAVLPEPDAGSIASALRRDLRRIKTHLEALTTLFAVHRLEPHPAGTGKPHYFLCDVAFAKMLGADFERQLHTWLLQEQLSQRSIRDDRESRLFHYRTPKGRKIHLVIESPKGGITALKLWPEERITEKDTEILCAFGKKLAGKSVRLLGLGPDRFSFSERGVEVYPWESLG